MVNEIEISGFIVMSETEVENFEELALSITWGFTYDFGDDDQYQIEFSDGEDLLSRIEFKEITSDEAKTLKRLFNDEFGTFISEDFLEQVIDDDDDDEDFDDEDYEIEY